MSDPIARLNAGEEPRDSKGTPADWVWARWRWLIVLVVLVFAFNNLVGSVVGIVGLIALANRIAGRLLGARSVVEQIRQIVADPDDFRDEVGRKGD